MINTKNYLWALLFGVLPYLLLQMQSLIRFGKINISFNYLDAMVFVVGVVSMFLLFYLMNRFKKKEPRKSVLNGFLIALPFSVYGILIGGLLGAAGIFVYGLVPILIGLGVGYYRARKK